MSSNIVTISGINTSGLIALTNEEMCELFSKREKDKQAREKLITGNLRLVLTATKYFRNSNELVDDIFQIGCIGLIKAVDNFDTSRGLKFSTYAVPLIVGEIKKHLRDTGEIKVSRQLKSIAYKVIKIKEKLIAKYSKEPTSEELAAELGVSKEDIVKALEAVQSSTSIYEPVASSDEDNLSLIDQLSDSNHSESRWVEDIELSNALSELDEKAHKIISLRFFKEKSQKEIAGEIGVSQTHISRLEKKALSQLKQAIS